MEKDKQADGEAQGKREQDRDTPSRQAPDAQKARVGGGPGPVRRRWPHASHPFRKSSIEGSY
jgi:hypothetical protein